MAKKPPARGDLLKVHWCDIYEDPTGDPSTAKPIERVSFGLFFAQEVRGPGECLITTTTLDKDGTTQSGYCIYPKGTILDIEVVKRAR